MAKSIGVLSKLPSELHYLIEPALKYGIHQTEDDRIEFLERAAAPELEELARVADRYRFNEHCDLVSDFFDDYPITEHKESAKLYWLFGVMDAAGLKISPEKRHTVERYIKVLGRFPNAGDTARSPREQRRAFRLASERARAAMLLTDFGDEAQKAIPALRQALKDGDLRVQVWAHYALAVIEGNRMEHEIAVREIYSQHNQMDELGCHVDDVGGEASCVLEKFSELLKERGAR